MKRSFIAIISIILAVACSNKEDIISKSDLLLNDTIALKYNIEYTNKANNITLLLDSITDSRCPNGVYCVWEGNASVYLNVTVEKQSALVKLHTHVSFVNDTSIKGYNFNFIDIAPYPEFQVTTNPDDYEAAILITKD